MLANKLERWVRYLAPVIYLACAIAFITDLTHDNIIVYGVAYLPLICTAVFHRRPSAVWWLAALTSLLVVIGYFLPAVSSDVLDSVLNRVLSLIAILVTAALVRYARSIQDRLAEQTARAEAGERIKADVVDHLADEIRTPLHGIIGFADLMAANCRPDQHEPLQQMVLGGRRLAATIDNLIDLTALDRRTLRIEPTDAARCIRDAVARQQPAASGVWLVAALSEDEHLPALADSWALSRILDNVLANAVRFTRKGGTVMVSADAEPDTIVATIEDGGKGLSPELLLELREPMTPAGWTISAGTGLTLSRRLAEAMHCEMSFEQRPEGGTIVRLRLPAADQASR